MNIPFFSFDKINAAVRQELSACFETFLDGHSYILGSRVRLFEAQYAAYCSTKFCSGVANGFDALVLSLKVLDIRPGDEIIVPSNTYIATWLAVSDIGGKIVPVEPRRGTCNINPELIEQSITHATKAIIPVHLYGQACEMEGIMQIADKHGLFVVEDNAQAQGARYKGKLAGSFGHVNASSFYPAKNLGAYGDAGAVTTDNRELFERLQALRNFGSKVKYYNEEKGCNSRLDELQAGFLSIRLRHLDKQNEERVSIAGQYDVQLAGVGDVQLLSVAPGATSVYHQYVILTGRRDALMSYLREQSIGTLIHYPVPPHRQQAYEDLGYKKGAFPLAEELAGKCLSLPVYPGLSGDEITYICQNIRAFYHG
jgi:dTDP-4-amino-4,6-dideoxygalactose transaminase